jgi:5-bromo-4-chloroindolyl phosphate hydrolysis protein
VESLASAARDMFRAVEEDPRDLTSSRKFLSVYLKGARDATIKFADLYSKNRDAEARSDYEALLNDLERSFDAQHKTMLLDDRSDLDVEITVLRDRLKQEGLRAGEDTQ